MRLGLKSFIFFIAINCFARMTIAAGKTVSDQLFDLSIEDLMQIEVTTVSRRSQKLTEVAAAAYVIILTTLQISALKCNR